MLALLLRGVLALSGVFLLLIGAVRGFAYDHAYFDHLRDLLILPDSAASSNAACVTLLCFLQIYPGTTPAENIEAVLKTHPWIGELRFIRRGNFGSSDLQIYRWQWSSLQPAFLTGENELNINRPRNLVDQLTLPTTITFGEIWLAFGTPSVTDILSQQAYYPHFVVRTPIACKNFWETPVVLLFKVRDLTALRENGDQLRQRICRQRRDS
jgi:hypothetical protein